VKIGAYYFHGWSGKTHHISDRLKTEFADREPVWGWVDDTVENMEEQIYHAQAGRIGFFAFCWYYPEADEKETPLNRGVELFLKAKNRNKMEFCLLVANHAGFRIGAKDWDAVVERWLPLLQEPNHLRIDGKPAIIIFSPHELMLGLGGSDRVKEAFDDLQRRAKAQGLPGVCMLGGAILPEGDEEAIRTLSVRKEEGYDYLTNYCYAYGNKIDRGGPRTHAFQELIDMHKEIWDGFAQHSQIPYIPVVTAGWDKRPWEREPVPQSWYYPDRTPEQVAQFVREAQAWMRRNPTKTSRDQVVIIYAWNEFGEGGNIAPTKGDGGRYLRVLSELGDPEEVVCD
jgi:hypothetical protein